MMSIGGDNTILGVRLLLRVTSHQLVCTKWSNLDLMGDHERIDSSKGPGAALFKKSLNVCAN